MAEVPSAAAAADCRKREIVAPAGQSLSKRSKKGKKLGSFDTPAKDELITIIPAPNSLEPQAQKEVLLNKMDAAPNVRLGQDGLSMTSSKGYRMVRATHGAQSGTWYFEVHIAHLGQTGHCRIGWSTKKAELQSPVGYDDQSFAYRDIEGMKVHKGMREAYGQGYSEGDVVGCLIHLPTDETQNVVLQDTEKVVMKYKGIPVVEADEETEAKALPGSIVAFTLNGQYQGAAYTDVGEGIYFPAASVYTLPEQEEGCTVEFNFGPNTKYEPPSDFVCPPKLFCEITQKDS